MVQDQADTKRAAMMPFQVTADLMAGAKQGAAFLHCLPAHRGEEVTAEVIDGPGNAVVYVGAKTGRDGIHGATMARSEEHTSELQSLMRISYAVFCLKQKTKPTNTQPSHSL